LVIAIYSNETFEADDERLNYESYKELSLICGEYRESSFLKKGEVRSPHFSHFRDTDKNSHWRKESDSSTQDTDSENRK
jgi:competence CoiA-like predicted nuclease